MACVYMRGYTPLPRLVLEHETENKGCRPKGEATRDHRPDEQLGILPSHRRERESGTVAVSQDGCRRGGRERTRQVPLASSPLFLSSWYAGSFLWVSRHFRTSSLRIKPLLDTSSFLVGTHADDAFPFRTNALTTGELRL
jgi:hypothetical protein